jgi:hypothetical protein
MLPWKGRQQDLKAEWEGDRKKRKENYDVGERADAMGIHIITLLTLLLFLCITPLLCNQPLLLAL